MVIRGPYLHSPSGRWRLRVDGDDRYFASEAEALEAKRELVGDEPAIEGAAAPENAVQWSALLAKMAAKVAQSPQDADLARAARACAQLASAARFGEDMREIRRARAEIEAKLARLDKAEQRGTRLAQPEPAKRSLSRAEADFDGNPDAPPATTKTRDLASLPVAHPVTPAPEKLPLASSDDENDDEYRGGYARNVEAEQRERLREAVRAGKVAIDALGQPVVLDDGPA